MKDKKIAALFIYGASLIVAIVVLLVPGTRPFDEQLVARATGFSLGISIIPFVFLYAKSVKAGYVAAFIVNLLFLSGAIAPQIASAISALLLVLGIAYYVFAPFRDAIKLFLYKRKSKEASDE